MTGGHWYTVGRAVTVALESSEVAHAKTPGNKLKQMTILRASLHRRVFYDRGRKQPGLGKAASNKSSDYVKLSSSLVNRAFNICFSEKCAYKEGKED